MSVNYTGEVGHGTVTHFYIVSIEDFALTYVLSENVYLKAPKTFY